MGDTSFLQLSSMQHQALQELNVNNLQSTQLGVNTATLLGTALKWLNMNNARYIQPLVNTAIPLGTALKELNVNNPQSIWG